ncbi:hypothetical protein [Planomonospora sp. ID82291]|uniref:hypothetical protein n=1 Tax=Planomonospora sp. ID82291 TaxID=2738136 RepID=UPI0018C3BDC6|nr:hypothetical protein [Planomonospora sp. ID82291]MBG0814164.1 hypothetical protein [Planomonospora sp. ID82291]
MGKKTDFAVYTTNHNAAFTMSYTCHCGQQVIGYGDDSQGLFTGTCGKGHSTTVMAS